MVMGVFPANADEAIFQTPQQRRAAVELIVLGVLTSGFLALFPRRPIYVDLGLALFAVSLVLLDANNSRVQFWGQSTVEVGPADRRRGVFVTMTLTVLVLLSFCFVGAVIGYQGADWPGVRARLLHPYIPTAVLLYLPWAWLQQTLFQFYLLGRVRTLCPSLHPLAQSALNGLLFGLVHATDIELVLLAALGGTLWSWLYLRDRRLWPLAISHALVGTTFYYWVYGYDLASRWSAFLQSLLT
jgi:membrane protease YdiL (CAAX protease family)